MSFLRPKSTNIQLMRELRSLKKSISKNCKTSHSESSQPILPLKEDDLQQLTIEQINLASCKTYEEVQTHDLMTQPKLLVQDHLKQIPSLRKLKDYMIKSPLTASLNLDNQYEKISEVVTPLAKLPYQKQLKLKERHFEELLRHFKWRLKSVQAPFAPMLGHLPCAVENIVPSPDLHSYRNKDEFSVHVGADGNPKTVGFFYGSPKDPDMRCVPPLHLTNIKPLHKLIAKHFQSYIRSSPHEPCLNFKEGGVWRHLVVRSNSKGQAMIIVVVHPKQLTEQVKEQLKLSLKHYFLSGPGVECGITSIYIQACMYTKCNRSQAPFELVFGETHLEEECGGVRCLISPDSFFQVNTSATNLLYDSVVRLADLSSLSTVVDVCCSIGILSILLSAKCRGTIGIDVAPSAIEDAKENAKRNQCLNANFIAGKAEQVLPVITADLENSTEVVVIINSVRAGLHPSVVDRIRACEAIRKVVLVSSRPDGMVMNNMVSLCSNVKPKFSKINDLGPPFRVRYAVPVDMYPSTLHSEYVFMFERSS